MTIEYQKLLDKLIEIENKQIAIENKTYGRNLPPGEIIQPNQLINRLIRGAREGGDFIITKQGEMIKTNPNDTIFAAKNPNMGGGNIYITIDSIYGMNPRDISIALKKELAMKVSI